MIIDNNPTVNEDDRTFEVQENIDTDEDISIFINGLMAVMNDDVEDITDNVITIKDIDIDYHSTFQVMYTPQ